MASCARTWRPFSRTPGIPTTPRCHVTSSKSFAPTSAAASSPTGRPVQTQYNSCSKLAEVRIVRRHHPLEGQRVEIVMAGPEKVVARVGDGTTMRMPRAWTDIDGAQSSGVVDRVFSLDAMLALIELVDVLGRRG
jgi:Family of unknown function (DUF5372)